MRLRGFKAGIVANQCEGLIIEGADVEEGYRQRLASTPDECRDDVDWLTPHNNDQGEWLKLYGGAISISDSTAVTVRGFHIRTCQNGLLLSRVRNSRIYDGDASWLSGWGLAMWRCESVTVSRNAFDGCIRGYSHGVYNRGQDSAGILFFEQNSRNVIAENSITKGGDGIFGFAGNAALNSSDGDPKRRGCNDNIFLRNDLSDAAAHGLELTFSFGNVIVGNSFERNAICGIWAGYCQDSWIAGNRFVWNGDAGYGLERGAINIDSGARNMIVDNNFTGDRCGIHLWTGASKDFAEKPWGKANLSLPLDRSWILANRFAIVPIPWHLRRGARAEIDIARIDMMQCSASKVEDDAALLPPRPEQFPGPPMSKEPELFGTEKPIGRLAAYRGRQHIHMTEWGPHDLWSGPPPPPPGRKDIPIPWDVSVFKWTIDPVTNLEGWRAEGALRKTPSWRVDRLNLRYGQNGPGIIEDAPSTWKSSDLGVNHFGTLATATTTLAAGRYRLRALFDDGLRVTLNGSPLITTWKWHPPAEESVEFTIAKSGPQVFVVEHFEIDGHAALKVVVEPIP